jgi:cell division septation protein DedD
MMSILTNGSTPEAPLVDQPADAPEEFEFVLGKRQVAGVLFLATVCVVVFAGLAYVAGEAMAPARTVTVERLEPVADVAPVPAATPPQPTTPQVTTPQATTPQATTPLPVATLVPAAASAPVARPSKPPVPQRPVFANPQDGVLYLQLGAVEKGIAVIFVDGLRADGFEAFAAPGPTEKIFRVLVGPLADHDAYQRAKKAVDDLGLNTFARKYQQ